MSAVRHQITRAWTAWRQPPWPLHPLSEMPRSYRLYMGGMSLVLLGVAAAAWFAGFVPHREVSGAYLAMVLLITLLPNLVVFRGGDVADVGTAAAMAMPLLFTGRTVEAIACMVLRYSISPLRKPLVRHLVVANLVNVVANMMITTVCFHQIVGDARVASSRWFLACLVSFGLYELLQYPQINVAAALGGYFSQRQGFRIWVSHATENMVASLPVAMMVAVMLSQPGLWSLLFMVVPTVVKYREWVSRDRLVDATAEASQDPLTGVMNRRSFLRVLEEMATSTEFEGEQRDWLIFCDLDNFKQLNDTYGHEAGDEALVIAANAIEDSTRRNDQCARYGGEEFVVLVQALDRENVSTIAERIRMNIQLQLRSKGTTVSIGVHGVDPNHETLEDSVYRADIAMYVSKTSGKNRVTFSDDPRVAAIQGKPSDSQAA
jgi:diguanylate cyclase (GGDEF)-like protein